MFHVEELTERQRPVLWFMLIWPFIAVLLSLALSPPMLGTILIFLVVPGAVLAYAAHDGLEVKRVFLFSFVMAVPGTIITDYLAEASGAWYITTIFPFKLFGLVTVEGFLWSLFTVFYVIMFYEYFVHHYETRSVLPSRMRYFVLLLSAIMIVATGAFMSLPTTMYLPYFYLVFGIVVILIPVIVEMLEFPEQISGMLKTGAYFFVVFFVYEVTALEIGVWSFPAHNTKFIGWVSFMGHRFPFEELLFYMLLFSMSLVAYYRFWDDYPGSG